MVQAVDRRVQQEAVTPARFAGAKTYAEYLGSITQNQHKFADNYMHWIERPERATAEMAGVMRPLFAAYAPQALAEKLGREPTEEEKAAAAQKRAVKNDEFQATNPAWGRRRDQTLEDITERLEQVGR